MQRRRYLKESAGLAAGAALLPLGGSVATPEADRSVDAEHPSGRIPSDRLPIPRDEFTRSTGTDAIPAIVDPAFDDDWSDLDVSRDGVTFSYPPLANRSPVIGVTAGSRARAYPLAILNWHEVVNDVFDGPLLVTYCPLCHSGIAFDRRATGTVPEFGVSGLLWRGNLVLYDRPTESLWSQLSATAVRGPLTGSTLSFVPSTLATWADWRREHPGTNVLLPPPFSKTLADGFLEGMRDYARNPYETYGLLQTVPGTHHVGDDRLDPKTMVLGVTIGGTARAYPVPIVAERGVINDTVAGHPIVIASAGSGPASTKTVTAYNRRVDGRTLTFSPADASQMRGGRSTWAIATGKALDGRYRGRRLERVTAISPLFWFAWVDTYPDTTVYSGNG